MSIRVGINGFGRIGKVVFRVLQQHPNIEVVGINDPADIHTLAYLLKYDTVHGRFNGTVEVKSDDILLVNGKPIRFTRERNIENLHWDALDVDVVVDSSGLATHRTMLEKHLQAGAKKVILSCPPDDDTFDKVIVIGVNDHILTSSDKVVSNASCTTNCLAPALKILDDAIGIESGFMNTVHPFTNNQRILDAPHSEYRRSRASAANIIPTTTSAIRALGMVMPYMKGKIEGIATRVPVVDGSLIELVLNLKQDTSEEAINRLMKTAAEGAYKGILEYTEDPIVSSDVINNPHSTIFDARATKMIGNKFAQLIIWYDNEFGYSNRVVDLIELISNIK